MYRLIFHSGRFKGRRIAVQEGDVLIGRDPACQIDLADDGSVSRRHAVLEQRKDGVWLRNLGSLNPPTVNDQIVDQEIKLRAGDRIEIGHTLIEFQPVEFIAQTAKRRPSRLQLLTIAAVVFILALEAVFIFVLPNQHQTAKPQESSSQDQPTTTPSKPGSAPPAPIAPSATPPATTPSPQPVPPPAAVAQTPAEPPQKQTVQPDVQREVQELKQAITGLREEVAALTTQRPSATPGAATATADTKVAPPRGPEPAVQGVAQAEQRQPLTPSRPTRAEPTTAAATPAPVRPPVTESPPPRPPPPALPEAASTPPPERPAEEDPLTARMRELLALAQTEMQKGNWLAADQAIERLLILSPDYVPALVERARLYEQRGLLKEAGDVWARIMILTAGTPLYNQAAAERQRLAREHLKHETIRRTAPAPEQPALPRRIRIVAIERERFPGSREFDELRLARVVLRQRLGEGRIDIDDVRIWVVFYDRILGTERVVPSSARVPEEPLRIETAWGANEQKSVTATYIVPKHFRAEEEAATGEKRAYEGVRVQVWYKGILQDEDAIPKSLLKEPIPPLPAEGSPLAPRAAGRPSGAGAPVPRR